jgi:hypothetical protein
MNKLFEVTSISIRGREGKRKQGERMDSKKKRKRKVKIMLVMRK